MTGIPGLELDEFTVLGILGQGGMGTVYRATQHSLKREVAIKVLDRQESASRDAQERFVQEVSLMGQLSHPNLVKLYLGDVSGDIPWFAMELLTGEPLDARIDREAPLPVPVCVRILEEMARGLEFLHAADIIHGDIKPSNVFITRSSGIKLLDFGLARLLESGGLSQPGAVFGTLDYMAPELLQEGAPSPRTDLWALGAVAYGMVTGRHHLAATNIRARITDEDRLAPSIVPPENVNGFLPRDLSVLVMRLLETDPARRPPTTRAFLDELQPVKEWVTGVSISMDSVWVMPTAAEPAAGVPTPVTLITHPSPVPAPRRRTGAILGGLAAIVAIAVGAFVWRPAAVPEVPPPSQVLLPHGVSGKPLAGPGGSSSGLLSLIPESHEGPGPDLRRYTLQLDAWLTGEDPESPVPRTPGAAAGPASAAEVELQTERLRLAGEGRGPQALLLALERIATHPDEATGWLVLSEVLLERERPGGARRALDHGLARAVPESLRRADPRTWRSLARGPGRRPEKETIERWWALARGSKSLRAPIQGLVDVLLPHQVDLYREILLHPLQSTTLDEPLVEGLALALADLDWAMGRLVLDRALDRTRSPALARIRLESALIRGEVARLATPPVNADLTPALQRILPYLVKGPVAWQDAGAQGEEHPRVRDFFLLEAGRVPEAEALLVEMHSLAAHDPATEPGGRYDDLGCLALELLARGDPKTAWLRLWRGHLSGTELDRHWSTAAGAFATGPASARFTDALDVAAGLRDRNLESAIQALWHARSGRPTQALEALEAMRQAPPDQIPVDLVLEVLARRRLGLDGKVTEVTVDPRLRALLGDLVPLDEALARSDLPAALSLARKLADVRPENPFHRYLVCWILSARKSPELEAARTAARAAIRWLARDGWALRELDALEPKVGL